MEEPLSASAVELPSIEEIEGRIVSLQDDTNLEADFRDRLVETYKESLEHLKQVRSWKEKSAAHQSSLDQIPTRSEEIRTELAQVLLAATPEIGESSTAADLEPKLAQSEAALLAAKAGVAGIEEKIANLAGRRPQLPELLSTARNKLKELQASPVGPPPADQEERLTAANRILQAAGEFALASEIEAYEKEIPLSDLLNPFYTLRRDLAVREVSRAETTFNAYQSAVSERRKSEAMDAAAKARREASAVVSEATADPLFKELANRIASENALLAERRTTDEGPVRGIEKTNLRIQEIESRLNQVTNDYANARSRVDEVGLDNSLGPVLRKHRSELPNYRKLSISVDRRQAQIARVQIERIDLREERYGLANLDAVAKRDLARIPLPASEEIQVNRIRLVRELRETQRGYLDDLLKDYATYISKLHDLDAKERDLVAEARGFADFIREHILWVPSGAPLAPTVFVDALQGLSWFVGAGRWLGVFKALAQDALSHPTLVGLVLLAVGLLLWRRKSLHRQIEEIGAKAKKSSCFSFGLTLEALYRILLLSVPIPIFLWLIGRRLGMADLSGVSEPDFVRSIGYATQVSSALLLFLQSFGHLVRRGGLAVSHFGWPEGPVSRVRRNLRWLTWVTLPTIFVCASLQWYLSENFQDSLGRLVYMVNTVAFMIFGHRALRPEGGSIQEILDFKKTTSRSRFRYLWYLVGAGIPAIILIFAFVGYYFTSLELGIQLFYTLSFTLATVTLYGLILRWLLVTRRRLSREQTRRHRELAKAKDSDAPGSDVHIEEEDIDFAKIDIQTRRLIKSCVGFAFVIGLWFIWMEELPALSILNQVDIPGTTLTETVLRPDGTEELVTTQVTLAHVALALLIGLLTIVATKNLPGLLEIAILQRLNLLPGERYALTTIVRYALVTVGVVFIFNAVGIGWAKVQWLVAGVSLGLGFGLQEIFANFVSGLIILFERPVRVGDAVTIGGVSGYVSKINIRATTITDFDRKELIVPNKEFVTGQLVNWSLSDSILRLIVPVGVEYGSDTELAEKLLYQVAEEEGQILDDPPPRVVFFNFGESSLDFELRVFAKDVDTYLTIRHELHMAIDQAFRKAGIVIAFPQRDLHVRSIPEGLLATPPGQKGMD